MASTTPRRRASTLRASEPEAAELKSQLQLLGLPFSTSKHEDTYEEFHKQIAAGHYIRQLLLESSGNHRSKDSFRHLNGFETVIAVIRNAAQLYEHHNDAEEEKLSVTNGLLQAIFGVLAAALHDHKGNQRYFRERVHGGGWSSLRTSLHTMLMSNRDNEDVSWVTLTERIFGCLLACALDDESTAIFFSNLKRHFNGINSELKPTSELESERAVLENSTSRPETDIRNQNKKVESTALIHNLLQKEISPLTIVHCPDAVLVMLELWQALESESPSNTVLSDDIAVSFGVPSTISFVATLSINNLAALHGTRLLNIVLLHLISSDSVGSSSYSELRDLATALLTLGVTSLDDARFLYRHARSSHVIADLLLSSLQNSRSPSYVLFDLSLNGFASIELPGIGRTFPPSSPSAGYTFSLWFQIVHFDPDSHTTLFGAFDASQTCFVLVYLEKDSHNLILQTSVTSSRPSVRFKSTSFKEARWYHVVIAHRRPKTTSSSRASLFVNGEFVEQVKSQYPAMPPLVNGGGAGVGPVSPQKSNAIQTFLGTPQDLATRLGKGLVFTKWCLASANLFADVLSDDLIAVYHELGSRYTGNYQDCLGSFQTYQASAALNLRNESLHPGKEEKSDIISAIRSKAGTLLPESKILLNISAIVVLDDNDQNNIDETHLLKFLSKTAGKNLRSVTRGGRNALAINGAIPSVNEALLHSSGFAVLTGNPTVVVPQSLDDAAWRIGGCAAVGLALLETAQDSDSLIRALDILFESVQDNWRNSEAMERENGFGVLSAILGPKLLPGVASVNSDIVVPKRSESMNRSASEVPLKVLSLILKFVGYRTDKPEDSVINNPLAYRILLVDMDYWRNAEPPVQKLYYEQFIVFGSRSKYHQFNAKRLSRMRWSSQ